MTNDTKAIIKIVGVVFIFFLLLFFAYEGIRSHILKELEPRGNADWLTGKEKVNC